MKTQTALVGLLVLSAIDSLVAHHNFRAEFDASRPFKLSGTVTRIEWTNKGIPRAADGTPNLSAPTPRTGDRVPDLAGVWQAASDPNGVAGGIEGIVGPKYMIDVLRDYKVAPMTAWAAETFKQRRPGWMVSGILTATRCD